MCYCQNERIALCYFLLQLHKSVRRMSTDFVLFLLAFVLCNLT